LFSRKFLFTEKRLNPPNVFRADSAIHAINRTNERNGSIGKKAPDKFLFELRKT
jgi:hypothetical protein